MHERYYACDLPHTWYFLVMKTATTVLQFFCSAVSVGLSEC